MRNEGCSTWSVCMSATILALLQWLRSEMAIFLKSLHSKLMALKRSQISMAYFDQCVPMGSKHYSEDEHLVQRCSKLQSLTLLARVKVRSRYHPQLA